MSYDIIFIIGMCILIALSLGSASKEHLPCDNFGLDVGAQANCLIDRILPTQSDADQ